jgi:hypothetical protein
MLSTNTCLVLRYRELYLSIDKNVSFDGQLQDQQKEETNVRYQNMHFRNIVKAEMSYVL